MTVIQNVVIVGAGEAGARVALELRARGFGRNVTLVGEERHSPYEGPPLSKDFIAASRALKPPTISDAARLGELDIVHIAGQAFPKTVYVRSLGRSSDDQRMGARLAQADRSRPFEPNV
jgi:2-polyprenyl-6-methoxyphenol hydroxylase-like FAD-dependent oxidoreductase